MPDRVVWTSPDGESIDLTDHAAGYVLSGTGTTGLHSPVYDVTADKYAGIDGVTIQSIRADVRTPSLGLFVEAESKVEFRTKARALVHAMRPKAGPGRLTVTTEWGDERYLECYCTGGFEGDLAPEAQGAGRWWRMVLKLYAPDPWWYGEEQTVSVGLGAPTTFFPIFPLKLSSSTVQGEFSVDLSGADSPAHPVWTVSGPGTSLILTNETTGQVLEVTTTVTAGQSIIIDTRPGMKSVRRETGVNLMSSVVGVPQLWPLVEGVNEVTAVLAGATADSRIEGTYNPRYAGI